MECLKVALSKAYSRVWYIAPSYRQAETVAWKLLLRTIPKELVKRYNNMKLEIELAHNGSIIELKGTENEDSLRGVGLDFAVLDEYAYMKPHIWGMIIQPMFATTGGRAMFIGTPDGKGHFYDLFREGLEPESNYKSFHYKSIESPYVDNDFIEGEKKRLPENVFKQEYEGSFEDFTGLIYAEFQKPYHIIEPFNIPAQWTRLHAIDPAISTGTTAALFTAIDEEGNIIIYDEFYEKNEMVSDYAEKIKKKCDIKNDMILMDPHAGNKTQRTKEGSFYAPIDEYREAGIYPMLGETHVDAGINRVREYLKVKEDEVNHFNKIKGAPRLYVFNSCHKFLWEIERYRWSDRPESKLGIMKPTPFKKNDHLMDCLRYICMSRPEGNKIEEEFKYGENSLYAILQYDERKRKRIFV